MTTTVIARGTEWSNNISNAGLGGFENQFDCPAQGKRAAKIIVDRFHGLCADAGFDDVAWIPGASEVLGDVDVDHDDIDLEALREQAYEEFDFDDMDEPTIDDLSPDEIQWDADDGFTFPKWLPDHDEATEHYALLAQYNRAYDLEITDLDDEGYRVYEQFCALVDKETPGLRFKNAGPYNPESRKTILSSYQSNYNSTDMVDCSNSNRWTKIEFSQSEYIRSLCKKLSVKYPWRWEYNREQSIKSVAQKMAEKPALELNGLKEAQKINEKKIADLQAQIDATIAERARLSEIATAKQAEIELAKIAAENWKNEQLK